MARLKQPIVKKQNNTFVHPSDVHHMIAPLCTRGSAVWHSLSLEQTYEQHYEMLVVKLSGTILFLLRIVGQWNCVHGYTIARCGDGPKDNRSLQYCLMNKPIIGVIEVSAIDVSLAPTLLCRRFPTLAEADTAPTQCYRPRLMSAEAYTASTLPLNLE